MWYPSFVIVRKKMGLEQGSLIPHDGLDLQEFNGTKTRPWGYVELMVSVGEDKDIRSINTHFLVIHCKSFYNCILWRLFTAGVRRRNFAYTPKAQVLQPSWRARCLAHQYRSSEKDTQCNSAGSLGRYTYGDQHDFPHTEAPNPRHPYSRTYLIEDNTFTRRAVL